jgi:hypothetical protein
VQASVRTVFPKSKEALFPREVLQPFYETFLRFSSRTDAEAFFHFLLNQNK